MNTSTSVYLKNVFGGPINAGGYFWEHLQIRQFSHLNFPLSEEVRKGVLAITDHEGEPLDPNAGGGEGGTPGSTTVSVDIPSFTVGSAITHSYTNPASPYPTPATATYTAKTISALGTAPVAIGAALTQPAAFTEVSEVNAALNTIIARVNELGTTVNALRNMWTPVSSLITNTGAAESRDVEFTNRLNGIEAGINTFRGALGTAIAAGLKSVADNVKPLTATTDEIDIEIPTGGASGGGLITPTDPLTIPLNPVQFK